MKLRVIAAALVLCIIAGFSPSTMVTSQASSALDQITVDSPTSSRGSGCIENTLYPNAIHPAVAETASSTALAVTNTTFYESLEEAAAALRAGLVARQSEITIGYTHQGSWGTELFDDIWTTAFAHTGVPTEGDYLQRQWGSCHYNYTYSTQNNTASDFVITYHPVYYTTAEQEAELNNAVEALLDGLDLWALSDYEKICGIYDWMCANIAYDYENLEDTSHLLKYTAYAALIDGTAVCQGYANLFYRLALELGVDARIISGIGNGGRHSWNIVKLGEAYYNADATWDSSLCQAGLDYQYFLCSDSDFVDHTRDEEYLSQDFAVSYPMHEFSYDPNCSEHRYEATVTEPTCENYGYTTYVCASCGSEIVADYIDALGHTLVDNVCTRCGLVVDRSGVCGDDLTWQLSEDGVLTIDGTGAMWEFDNLDQRPWASLSGDILHVVFGAEVISVGAYAFMNCVNLNEVELNEGIKSIGIYAFCFCPALTNIVIPGSVTQIGFDAFAQCENLNYVKFESDPELEYFTMYGGAFAGCFNLESFLVEDGHITLHTVDGALFSGDSLMQYPAGKKETTWSVPDGTTSIGSGAFEFCLNLKDIRLNEGLKSIDDFAFSCCYALVSAELNEGLEWIGSNAFAHCSVLTSIVIPGSVAEIGYAAFSGCMNLKEVELNEGLEWINSYAFAGCSALTSIVIPSGVTGIGYLAFNGCGSLQGITFTGDAPVFIDEAAFQGVTSTARYPADNATWTEDVMQDYGGTITWLPICQEHDYKSVVTDPTCTEAGYTTHTCSVCGGSYVDSYVDAAGHDRSAGLCTVCGHDAVVVTVSGDTLTITSDELAEGTLLYLAAYDGNGKFLSMKKIVWSGGWQSLILPVGEKWQLMFVSDNWAPLRSYLKL